MLREQHCGVRSPAAVGRSLYTYNSRGLGRTGGFLTGWMMAFAYALYVPAGIALTSAYASQVVADTVHVTIGGWLLLVILGVWRRFILAGWGAVCGCVCARAAR